MELTKEEIEKIIDYQIVVDCYTEEEVNVGWAIFMEENLNFPFKAEYLEKRSGRNQWRTVNVINNETDETNFEGDDFYVEIEFDEIFISVSLDELRNIKADKDTMKAIEVWNSRNSY